MRLGKKNNLQSEYNMTMIFCVCVGVNYTYGG